MHSRLMILCHQLSLMLLIHLLLLQLNHLIRLNTFLLMIHTLTAWLLVPMIMMILSSLSSRTTLSYCGWIFFFSHCLIWLSDHLCCVLWALTCNHRIISLIVVMPIYLLLIFLCQIVNFSVSLHIKNLLLLMHLNQSSILCSRLSHYKSLLLR